MNNTPVYRVFIPKLFPGQNEVLRLRGKNKKFGWSRAKKRCELIVRTADAKRYGTFNSPTLPNRPYLWVFTWREWNTKRDPDNISAGGGKPILDALQQIGVLDDDGWDQIGGINHRYVAAETEDQVGVVVEAFICEEFEDEARLRAFGKRGDVPDHLRIISTKESGSERPKRRKNLRKMKWGRG